MIHSISKNTEFGNVEIQVSKSITQEKSVTISIMKFDHENTLIDGYGIILNENEYFDLIGTLLFVQSQIKKNEK